MDAPCDDGSSCTSDDTCSDGECLGAPVVCDEPGTCQVGVCDPEEGCVYTFEEGLPCEDGNVCTEGDTCQGLGCVVGTPVDCEDGNSCTVDSCDPEAGCISEALEDGSPCDDGNQCALGDVCTDSICAPGSEIVICDDGDPCTVDKCEPAEGCTYNVQQTNACRPIIAVTFPDRAESVTVEDVTAPITVTGTVSSLAAPIVAFSMNGEEVTVGDDGSFSQVFDPTVGGNILVFETENELGWTRRRVQAFHFSSDYIVPSIQDAGAVDAPCEGEKTDSGCWTAYASGDAPISWVDAESICINNGGHLAAIHSEVENDVVRGLIDGTCGEGAGAWIGLTDSESEGTFVWTDGSPLDFAPWANDEPNDFGDGEDYAEMWEGGVWNDSSGAGSNCYVCYVPSIAGEGVLYGEMAEPGLGVYLTQEALDDGDSSLPANDFATVLGAVFTAFDLNEVIPNPVAQGVEGGGATYDIYIDNLNNDQPELSLTCIDGGFEVVATIKNIKGDFFAQKTAGGIFTPGDLEGDLTLDELVIVTDVILNVDSSVHALDANFENTDVSVGGIAVDVDGLFGGLIGGALEGAIDGFATDIETLLVGEIPAVLGPVVGDTLSALAFAFDIELPSLNPDGAAVPISLQTDFSYTDFAPGGGMLALRAGAFPTETITPYPIIGAPARVGCDGSGEQLVVVGGAPLEVTLTDDAINTILLAAWEGGFMEFEAPESLFGDFDLSAFGITDLVAYVSGMLPPSVSNCSPDGEPMMTIGDIQLMASMNFAGEPLDLEIYASLAAEFNLSAADGGIGFGLGEISILELELTALQDSQIGLEPLVAALLEEQALPGLLEGLQGDALGGIPLPSIALSEDNPDLALSIIPLEVVRVDGNSVVLASLNPDDATEGGEEEGGAEEGGAEEGGAEEGGAEEGGAEEGGEEEGGEEEGGDVTGNCSSDADSGILATYTDQDLASVGSGCGTSCFFAGNQAQCISDCYADEIGISSECSSCFGESGQCAIDNCAGTCASDSGSDNCLSCLADAGCTDNFNNCAYGQ